MFLTVDFGNTRIKSALFKGAFIDQLVAHDTLDEWKSWVDHVRFEKAIVSNVGQKVKINEILPEALILRNNLIFPFHIDYKTPKTLGVDRLALCSGVRTVKSTENPFLVIDLGTCITYDYVDARQCYRGGGISPGMQLRFTAMHTFTQSLPSVNMSKTVGLVGDTTEKSMQSGVFYGVISELEGVISRYRTEDAQIEVYLTGGDAEFFESKINHHIFVTPNLALIGLKKILELNTQ